MKMAYRLVHLIENHSEALAACLLHRVQNSDATPGYKHVPREELKDRVHEIYRHLGDWLMTKDELDLKLHYSELGMRRAQQQVPLSQLVWTIVLTKENLREYIKKESVLERVEEVFGEIEMMQLLDRFFDSAIYYAATGYECKTEEELKKTEKLAATGRLAAAFAHEINNPLDTLSNLIYILGQSDRLDSNDREYLQLAQEELRRAVHVTRQMLTFHRQSSKSKMVDICTVLDSVLKAYRPLTDKEGITVLRRFDSEASLCAFPEELHQVFANLVRNAIDAVRQNGKITVHVLVSHERNVAARPGVRTVIADTGSGISSENRQRIFEPFFTTKGESGTGLGLWVCRGIIQKYGGSIRFRSTLRKGCSGTAFSVFLPFETAFTQDRPSSMAASAT